MAMTRTHGVTGTGFWITRDGVRIYDIHEWQIVEQDDYMSGHYVGCDSEGMNYLAVDKNAVVRFDKDSRFAGLPLGTYVYGKLTEEKWQEVVSPALTEAWLHTVGRRLQCVLDLIHIVARW